MCRCAREDYAALVGQLGGTKEEYERAKERREVQEGGWSGKQLIPRGDTGGRCLLGFAQRALHAQNTQYMLIGQTTYAPLAMMLLLRRSRQL
jgi:hypothetical protein